jgi:hypothetical protein
LIQQVCKNSQEYGKKYQPPATHHTVPAHSEEAQPTSPTDGANSEPQTDNHSQDGKDNSNLNAGMDI